MMAIAHMAFGISIAFAILIWYPQVLPNFLKNDVFFVFVSGIWSLIPDIKMVVSKVNSEFLHQPWANIFWGHPWIDSWTKDDPKTAAIFIAIAILVGYLYYRKLHGG